MGAAMNNRLETIISCISDGIGVIDVGTDHGYLPAELSRRGYRGKIFASDINAGPLDAARRTAERAGIFSGIQFLLCDGLALCPPGEIDTIVIAGMGGDLICRILDRAEWCMDGRYTLVLQPMTKPEILRYWLVNNEFEICSEALTEDSGTIYQVLTARFGGKTRLRDAELFTGAYEMVGKDPLFPEFYTRLTARFEKAAAGLEKAKDAPAGRLGILYKIIEQLKEMNIHG